jgi:hypothetical protein
VVTFCSINELEAANDALKDLKKDNESLYQKLLEVVYLTRALNFKFHYMGALIMDEDADQYTPNSVHESVLRLYKKELRSLKRNSDFPALKQIFSKFKHTGYTNISCLILGLNPIKLVGASYSK